MARLMHCPMFRLVDAAVALGGTVGGVPLVGGLPNALGAAAGGAGAAQGGAGAFAGGQGSASSKDAEEIARWKRELEK
eukprot:2816869-Karenia_brevis.AAC.1